MKRISGALLVVVLLINGCAEPPAKIEETPTSKVLDRLTEAKRRYRELPDIKPDQLLKKATIQKDYFTPMDLERTQKYMNGSLPTYSIDRMNKLLDEADKEMTNFPK